MLSILASVAQGESEDFSGNNRWSIINRFKDGSFIVGTPAYGYRKDESGNLIIEETEAEVVRWIFESYLNGMGTYAITKLMNERKLPTIREGEKWQVSAVRNILQNPVYEGNELRQRTYTERQFPFIRRVNKGQVSMYLTQDAHPPIITHEEAEAVISIAEYRSQTLHMIGNTSNRYLFTSRITCEGHFRRQKVYMGKPYERIIWICQRHVEDKESCHMKAIREDVIQQAFISMWNKLYTNQGTLLEPLLKSLTELVDHSPATEEIEK